MFVNSNIGKIEIVDIDESTKQIADHNGDNYDKDDEVVLADWEGYGTHWTATKHIVGYNDKQSNSK